MYKQIVGKFIGASQDQISGYQLVSKSMSILDLRLAVAAGLSY